MKENRLEVCFKKDLFQKEFTVKDIHWNYTPTKTITQVTTKIRYSHKGALSTLHLNKNAGQVVFDTPQNAVTPGQAAVFYKDDQVLGAGFIQ